MANATIKGEQLVASPAPKARFLMALLAFFNHSQSSRLAHRNYYI